MTTLDSILKLTGTCYNGETASVNGRARRDGGNGSRS